jgi:erythronate-4-phosphate dehydrogenase
MRATPCYPVAGRNMTIVVDSKNPFLTEALAPVADARALATAEITREALAGVDAVIVRSETKIGPALLDGTRVQFVGTATIGTDHVDLPYLRKRGIRFASAPGSNANSVAEYVATALLVAAGRLGWKLRGKTLGVVGVGNVGSKVVRVGEALGMTVLQNDPPLARKTGTSHLQPLEALMDADILTLHVPLTREGEFPTHHLVDRARIERMKPGALLLNTSRGGVVDSPALVSALETGHLAGVILDVWEREPDIDMRLLSLSLLGTPHIAGYSYDGKVNAARLMFEEVCRHFGWTAAWTPPGMLPAPAREIVTIDPAGDAETVLRTILSTCYDIETDDRALRSLLQASPDDRPVLFRRLRSMYPVRREFAATRVHGHAGAGDLSGRLTMLGFRAASYE